MAKLDQEKLRSLFFVNCPPSYGPWHIWPFWPIVRRSFQSSNLSTWIIPTSLCFSCFQENWLFQRELCDFLVSFLVVSSKPPPPDFFETTLCEGLGKGKKPLIFQWSRKSIIQEKPRAKMVEVQEHFENIQYFRENSQQFYKIKD